MVTGLKTEKFTHGFRLGETSQSLDRLGNEGEGSRGGWILVRQDRRGIKSSKLLEISERPMRHL